MSQRLENALPPQVSELKTVQTFILKPGREYVNMLPPDPPTRDFFLIKAVMCHFTIFFPCIYRRITADSSDKTGNLREESILNIYPDRLPAKLMKAFLFFWRLNNKFILCTNTIKPANTVTKQDAPRQYFSTTHLS